MALSGVKKIEDVKSTDYSKHFAEAPVTATAKPITAVKSLAVGPKGTSPEPSVSETLHPGLFTDKHSGMLLGVEGSRTINLGDYNSARVGLSLTIPCEPDSLEAAYEWGTEWISKKIEKEVSEAIGK